MSNSISEEFKDAKINLMLEDLISFENEIRNIKDSLISAIQDVPSALDVNLSIKLNKLLEVANELDSDIENSKSSISTLNDEIKHDISKHTSIVVNDLKKEITSFVNLYKSEIKKSSPISFGKIVIIFVFSLLISTLIISGSFYYVAKNSFENDLNRFGHAMIELSNFTEQTIKQLPQSQQPIAQKKYEEIMQQKR